MHVSLRVEESLAFVCWHHSWQVRQAGPALVSLPQARSSTFPSWGETVGLDFSPPTVNVAAVAVASKVRNRLCSHRLWTEGREVLGWTELGLPWRCQRPWQNRRRSSCRL